MNPPVYVFYSEMHLILYRVILDINISIVSTEIQKVHLTTWKIRFLCSEAKFSEK